MKPVIAVVGTFDTKGTEYQYIVSCIKDAGGDSVTIDVGSRGKPIDIEPQISAIEVAEQGGSNLESVGKGPRSEAIEIMGRGAGDIVKSLFESGKIDGIISIGGGGGSFLGVNIMQRLPFGFPKVMVSTFAAAPEIFGGLDIIVLDSIVDVNGLNHISKSVYKMAAGVITGAAANRYIPNPAEIKPCIAVTMFGNTTLCVMEAKQWLESHDYEVLIFHANGTGGKNMEKLIRRGDIAGVLDITTTEWADFVGGGVSKCDEDRMTASIEHGIPQVVSVGALDMINLGVLDAIPATLKGRRLIEHVPNDYLMRTNMEENKQIGEIMASRLNRSTTPCSLFLPLQGLSQIDIKDGPFYGPEENKALFDSLKNSIHNPHIDIVEMDHHISDKEFALSMARQLDELIQGDKSNAI